MLLQSLRALCKAPGGPGSIWKYLEALVRATRVSGRFACGFRTDLHFADVDGPAGRPADNPPTSDGLGVYHRTVPLLTVRVYWRPGPPIWQRFGWDPDPDPKLQSGTVANTNFTYICKLFDR